MTARPGACFGPEESGKGHAIFLQVGAGASILVCRKLSINRAHRLALDNNHALNKYAGENSLGDWAKIIDCGDVPLTYFDNTVALKQLEKAHRVCETPFIQ